MTTTDAPSLRDRLHNLEDQLREQTERRERGIRDVNEAQSAILQLQGAIAVVKDLLTPQEIEQVEDKAS